MKRANVIAITPAHSFRHMRNLGIFRRSFHAQTSLLARPKRCMFLAATPALYLNYFVNIPYDL